MEEIKLYVGNLPYNISEEDLSSAFGQAGNVSDVFIVKDKFTGKARGFAFVTLDSEEAANKAIEMFNGEDFGGRELVVNIARPKEERSGGGGGGRNFGGGGGGGFGGGRGGNRDRGGRR